MPKQEGSSSAVANLTYWILITRSSQATNNWTKNCALMWILSQQVPVVSRKIVWEIRNEMQAEGGFGSRQFDIGCLVSVVEFGPQQLADAKTTRPAFKILREHLTWEQIGLVES
jgi:hypothetical protein